MGEYCRMFGVVPVASAWKTSKSLSEAGGNNVFGISACAWNSDSQRRLGALASVNWTGLRWAF
jgi:hypothetical protein